MRLIQLIAVLLACLGLAGAAAAAETSAGFLHRPLADVEQSSFFTWFHLEESARSAAADGQQVVRYKPSGPRFHSLVTLAITVDGAGFVERLDLLLLRAFIDSPGNGPFARDIAKSFLADAPPATDADGLATLASEVEHRASGSAAVLVGPGYRKPELPSEPSDGYKTFAGARESYSQTLSRSALEMKNEAGPDGEALHMAVIAQ
ncbi:MAG: hypothetical protein ACHQF3_09020 [Alphaproteobacteria bacterium]